MSSPSLEVFKKRLGQCLQKLVFCTPSNPKSLYFYESEQKLSRHTLRAPLAGSVAGFLAGCRIGSFEPAQFPSMSFLASADMSNSSQIGMAGGHVWNYPNNRRELVAFSTKKRDAQRFAASRNCPNAGSSCLEKCQVSEPRWAAYSGTQHCPHKARTSGT